MKIYQIEGYFGYWGMLSILNIPAKNKTEAFKGLKKKAMEAEKGCGKGANQKKFYCKPIRYRVIQILEDYKDCIKK